MRLIMMFLMISIISCTSIGKTKVKYGKVVESSSKIAPIREMRGVWIASVGNINWPSRRKMSMKAQKREFIKLLDKAKAQNLNAVFVQVRPSSDALYASSYEPWSKYVATNVVKGPGYDPLKFMVEEAHKRNLEFHAWFNPFRATYTKYDKIPKSHPASKKKNRHWTFTYNGKKYLNPGEPQVRRFINKVILEVVKKYDIDGVHLDDYFYPYKIKNKTINDRTAYRKYGKKFKNIADWRRDNINKFIYNLSNEIRKEKPYVSFGVSPFGVWRNRADDKRGSDTRAGVTNYDTLFADTKLWVKKGWIDYIIPQIYWNFGFKPAAYEKLVKWWTKEVGKQSKVSLYIGHAAYKVNKDKHWKDKKELAKQVSYNRNYKNIGGSVFFDITSLNKNLTSETKRELKKLYKYPALVPRNKNKFVKKPKRVTDVKLKNYNLSWKSKDKNTSYFVVYMLKNPKEKISGMNIHKIVTKKGRQNFKINVKYTNVEYRIVPYSRTNVEGYGASLINFY